MIKIFPILVFLEIGVFCYFLSKGYGLEKIKVIVSICKLKHEIKESKIEIQKSRIISDKEVISHFVDNFEIPANVSSINKFYKIISLLSKFARKIIKL